jgi:hypothetical protein
MPLDLPLSADDGNQLHAELAGAPTAEAILATRLAGEIVRELHEAGRQLRFTLAPSRARVEVLLCDIDGMVLSRVTPARVLEIATGSPVVHRTR